MEVIGAYFLWTTGCVFDEVILELTDTSEIIRLTPTSMYYTLDGVGVKWRKD